MVQRPRYILWEHWFWTGERAPEVKSTGCFSRGPRFSSQHLHDGLQSPITPVLGNQNPGLQGHQICIWYTYIHTGKILLHVTETSNIIYIKRPNIAHIEVSQSPFSNSPAACLLSCIEGTSVLASVAPSFPCCRVFFHRVSLWRAYSV